MTWNGHLLQNCLVNIQKMLDFQPPRKKTPLQKSRLSPQFLCWLSPQKLNIDTKHGHISSQSHLFQHHHFEYPCVSFRRRISPPLADFKILLRLWPHASAQLLSQLPRRGRQAVVAALFGQLWYSQDPQGVAMNRQESAKVTYRKSMGNPFGYVIKIYRKVQ